MIKSIKEMHKQLLMKKITPSQIVIEAFSNLKKVKNLNATILELEKEALKLAKILDEVPVLEDNFLFAIPYGAKDNFATKNITTTAGSKILANFVPPYDAEAIKLLSNKKTVLLAKTALDELGMGGDGLYCHTGYVYNPWDHKRIVGGSSSGSAALVAAGVVSFALGSDTGDSIRKPASYVGIVGFKPSYGLISRVGLFPYAPSLDTVGYFTNNVEDCTILLDCLAKYDAQDSTSQFSNEKNYYQNYQPNIQKYRVAYIEEVENQLPDFLKSAYHQFYQQLASVGHTIESVSVSNDLLKAIVPVYMIISYAEAVSSHGNLTGINFGVRQQANNYIDVMTKSRQFGFGQTVKRRYAIGTYVLLKENQKLLLVKAKKIRQMLVNELNKIFKNYDILVLPPATNIAPEIKEVENYKKQLEHVNYFIEDILILGNFMGNPSITIPFKMNNNLPIGINFNSAPFTEQKLLNFAGFCESLFNFKSWAEINNKGENNYE